MGQLVHALKGLKAWQAAALAAVLVGSGGVAYGAFALASGPGGESLAQGQQAIPVQYGDLVNQVSTSGSLAFPNRAVLAFGTQGTVAELLVAEGQGVEEGQELARLDQATTVSLERAVAQARVSLRNAEDALAAARGPATALDAAQAEAKVASAAVALRNAQDALASLMTPSAQQVAQAGAAVASGAISVRKAQEALDAARSGPPAEDMARAERQGGQSAASLESATGDLSLARREWDAKVQAADDAFTAAWDGYTGALRRWLGIAPAPGQEESPGVLLALWGIDLASLFDPALRFQGLGGGWPAATASPDDDPSTPWSEPVVFFWMNLFPGTIAAACEDGVVPARGRCVRKEMDDAWEAFTGARDALDTARTQAAKAIAGAESAVSRAEDTLTAAEEALADLRSGPDALDVESKEQQLLVAQAALDSAREELAGLTGQPDPLEVQAGERQVAVAEASLARAEEELAALLGGTDTLEVAVKEADAASARLALETASQRLEVATLRSPFAGLVSLVNVVAGQAVNATTPILEVVDPSVVELDGVVDEIDVLFVREGALADVTMDALPGQVLPGSVSTIASSARSQQGVVSYPIRIRVEVPAGVQLREGLSATASIVIREERDVLLVPIQALYDTFQQPVVKVLSGGRVEERQVVLGGSDDYWVAVRDGLAPGEQVVMEAQAAATGQFAILGGSALRQLQGQFPGAILGGGFQGQRMQGQMQRGSR